MRAMVIRRKGLVLGLLVFAAAAFAQSGPAAAKPLPAGPFPGLGDGDLAALGRGEALLRTPSTASQLTPPLGAPGVDELMASMKRLGPNYLVEMIARVHGGDAGILDRLVAALSTPEAWVGIPYYSVRQGRTYDLYDLSVATARTRVSDGEQIEARHHMQPFEPYTARYEYHRGPASLLFSGSTTAPLVYKGIRAVGPGELQWRILAWKSGEFWYFYGVGAVRAFDLFGAARDRLEPSFIGRTEAFFKFMRGRFGG